MWSCLLAAALLAAPSVPSTTEIAQVTAEAQTGTLLFSRGDCLAVRVYSQSAYTHVAIVVKEGNDSWAYDAMPGPGVRRTPLAQYLYELTPGEVEIFQPLRSIEGAPAVLMQRYLESQLGRPYQVRQHLTGCACAGVHCSEYVTEALMAAELMTARQPARVTPGSLLEGVVEGRVYALDRVCELTAAPVDVPEEEGWCGRQSRRTTACCEAVCDQLSRWFLCRSK